MDSGLGGGQRRQPTWTSQWAGQGGAGNSEGSPSSRGKFSLAGSWCQVQQWRYQVSLECLGGRD